MRNKLIVLAIVICSFFAFKLGTKAYSVEEQYYLNPYKEFESLIDKYKINETYQQFLTYYETVKRDYPYYMIVLQPNFSRYKSAYNYELNFNYYLFDTNPQLLLGAQFSNSFSTCLSPRIQMKIFNGNNINFNYASNTIVLKRNESNIYTFDSNNVSNEFQNINFITTPAYCDSSVKKGRLHYLPVESGTYASGIIYDNNFDIKLWYNKTIGKYYNYKITFYDEVIPFVDGFEQNLDFIDFDNVVPNFKQFLQRGNPTMQIYTENTLYNDDNELIQLKIHVLWSHKNLSNYQYRFKTKNTTNYKYFFDNSLENEVIVNANDIYTFEITDLEGNIIASQTVNIDLISNNVLPTLKLEDYTGIGCYYDNQQICAILTLYSDNADFSKYTLQYRFTDGEWITHNYENSAKGQIVIYENTTITARLIRNSDNKLIDSTSHTITKIDPNIKFDVPTFKWDKLFCTNMSPNEWHEIGQGNFKQTLKLTIYGLDMNKYHVFVSTDGANTFDEIIQFDYEDRVPLVKYYYFEYYEDTSLIIKITDLEGNYVTSATFDLHFTCNDVDIKLGDIDDMNDVFKTVTNFFDKFKNIMMKIKEVIEYFYNSLNSEIKAFILTAFILIIVLNLIMRMMK